MDRRTYLTAVAVGSGSLVSGCLGNGEEVIEDPDEIVTLEGTSYNPLRLEIDPGEAVQWVNESDRAHTVSSYSEAFSDSWDFNEPLDPGEEVGFRFEEEGVFLYRCTQHTRHVMCAAVLVGDVSLDETLVCE